MQMVRMSVVLEEHAGKRHALQVLRSVPVLLNSSPLTIAMNLEVLAQLFTHPGQLRDMVLK